MREQNSRGKEKKNKMMTITKKIQVVTPYTEDLTKCVVFLHRYLLGTYLLNINCICIIHIGVCAAF